MNIKEKWTNFKTLVASFVVWAETEFKGKTGAQKLTVVVDMIYDKFPWPFPLRLCQRPILKLAVGWVAGKIVEALNIVTDHDFADIAMNPEKILAIADMSRSVLAKAQNIEAETRQETVEERFKALCADYGIEAEAPVIDTPGVFPHSVPEADDEAKPAQSYFQRSEFACKDGCGTNRVRQELMDMLNVIRGEFGKPVTVTSGTRCVANNAKAGGATNSNHLTGHAADIRCTDRSMTPAQMYEAVMRLHNQGKIPQLAGIGRNYASHIHVDVYPKRADGTLRVW